MLQKVKISFYVTLLSLSVNMSFYVTSRDQLFSSNTKSFVAPEFYNIVIPKLQPNPSLLYKNLYYEGNNIIMREINVAYPSRSIGYFISMNWREKVNLTKATFVLRDALFSQQDHPYKFVPFSLMLPANWITASSLIEDSIKLVLAPAIYDEESWCKIKTAQQMFGSFPKSEKLFKLATRRPDLIFDTNYTYNARATIQMLAKYARKLSDWRKIGINKMIEEGADLIAKSDTLYFSNEIRQKHIIPIMVENPTQHEILEGKGIGLISNNPKLNETIATIRRIVYKRRLADGDIAIERYDISSPLERKRAINVLEELIPMESSGATVWLWVTGKIRNYNTLQGEDASKYIDRFLQEIRVSDINLSRLRFVNKPSFKLSKKNPKQFFKKSVKHFRQLNLYESVNLISERLKYIINSK